jgi:hypothetical protein
MGYLQNPSWSLFCSFEIAILDHLGIYLTSGQTYCNSWLLWTPLPSHLPVGCLMIKFGSGRGILSCGICRRTQGPESHLNQPCKWPSFSFGCFSAPFLNCTNHSLLTLWSNMATENPRKPATIICYFRRFSGSHRQNLPVVIWSVQRFPRIFHVPSPRVYSRADCPKICMADPAAQSVSMAEGSDGSTISGAVSSDVFGESSHPAILKYSPHRDKTKVSREYLVVGWTDYCTECSHLINQYAADLASTGLFVLFPCMKLNCQSQSPVTIANQQPSHGQ